MIFHEKPVDFKGRREVANCFIECHGQLLLLLRNPDLPDPQAGKWGLPGGTVEAGEFSSQALWRELPEETGIAVERDEAIFVRRLYVRYDDELGQYEFTLDLFHLSLMEKPEITLNRDEHSDACWVAPQDALWMNLMKDLEKFIELRYPQGM